MRKDNWRVDLFDYFKTIKRIPFDPDTNNCVHFVIGGWSHIREDDIFARWRRCKSYAGMLKLAKRIGVANHADYLARFLPAYEHVTQACVGDIAVFEVGTMVGFAAGYVIGDRVFVLNETGLATYPLSAAIMAFKV